MWVFPNSLHGIGIIMVSDRTDTADSAPDRFSISGASGHRLAMRLVEPSDATFIHGLRTDPAFNRHLSVVTGDVADQRAWIEGYKQREAEGREFYYVFERLDDGAACGLVRLYEITQSNFTWGSWIMADNKPAKGALESALLSFEIGFETLDRPLALVDVRRDNAHAFAFYQRLGMRELRRDEQDIYLDYSRDQFRAARDELWRVVEGRN